MLLAALGRTLGCVLDLRSCITRLTVGHWRCELRIRTCRIRPGGTVDFTDYQSGPNSKLFAVVQDFALSPVVTTTNFGVCTQHISRKRIPSLQKSPIYISLCLCVDDFCDR